MLTGMENFESILAVQHRYTGYAYQGRYSIHNMGLWRGENDCVWITYLLAFGMDLQTKIFPIVTLHGRVCSEPYDDAFLTWCNCKNPLFYTLDTRDLQLAARMGSFCYPSDWEHI